MCCASSHGNHQHQPEAEVYPWDFERYCRCMGLGMGVAPTLEQSACCGARSGDDGLCDRCRTYCQKPESDSRSVEENSDSHGDRSQSLTTATV